MIPLRDARYCNIKLFLIYLVILGHWIEPMIWESRLLHAVYRWIYSFHMPLFAFLTGLFVKDSAGCKQQAIRLLKIYIPCQVLAVLLSHFSVSFFTPYWHLWYLLSAATWLFVASLWFKRKYAPQGLWILLLGVVCSCCAGYLPWIHRGLSLSRSLVFFPYFFAGVLCKPQQNWSRLRRIAIPIGLIGGFLLYAMQQIPTEFFYQAESYGTLQGGMLWRILSYGVGASFCLLFLSFVPDKRHSFSKLGADTLPAYLLHAPLVLLLRKLPLPWWMLAVLSFVLLYLLFKLTRWHRNLYGIT